MTFPLNTEQATVLNNLMTVVRNWPCIDDVPRQVAMINHKEGSFDGCVSNLISLHETKSAVAWFFDHSLENFKQEAWIASKLSCIHNGEVEPRSMFPEGRCLFGVLSDHESIIQWLIRPYTFSASGLRVLNNVNDAYFRHFQVTLALRGDWDQLAQRAELFLSNVPTRMKKFAPDQRFYLALAHGDRAGMLSALEELTAPKLVKGRRFDLAQFGFFIAEHATMYAKIAWRHGHELAVDTPMIPKEWLPVQPLAAYEDPYEFMRAYEIKA
jgi:Immunity protein 49